MENRAIKPSSHGSGTIGSLVFSFLVSGCGVSARIIGQAIARKIAASTVASSA